METFAVWTISGGADLDAVRALVACAAEKAGMPKARDAWGREVLVQNDPSDEFVRALSECDENWTDKGWPAQPSLARSTSL